MCLFMLMYEQRVGLILAQKVGMHVFHILQWHEQLSTLSSGLIHHSLYYATWFRKKCLNIIDTSIFRQ